MNPPDYTEMRKDELIAQLNELEGRLSDAEAARQELDRLDKWLRENFTAMDHSASAVDRVTTMLDMIKMVIPAAWGAMRQIVEPILNMVRQSGIWDDLLASAEYHIGIPDPPQHKFRPAMDNDGTHLTTEYDGVIHRVCDAIVDVAGGREICNLLEGDPVHDTEVEGEASTV